MKKIEKQKGSIALISVLIISAILLILILGMSESSVTGSYQSLNKSSNQIAYHTAEACLEETIMRMEDDINFTGVTLSFDETTCTSVTSGENPKTISIEVEYMDYVQHFAAQVSVATMGQANNVKLLNWEKI
jgi:Tfp pilus assembly protein PilX